MLALLSLLAAAQGADATAPAPAATSGLVHISPIGALVLKVNEVVGPTTKELGLVAEPSLSDPERAELARALGSMYALVPAEGAALVLTVRHEGGELVGLLEGSGGAAAARLPTRLVVSWPGGGAAGEPALDEETRFDRLQTYRRERLLVQAIVRGMAYPGLGLGGSHYGSAGPGWGVAAGANAPVPVSTAPNDWVVLRGAAEVLDEPALAALVGDRSLERRVEEARFWPRVFWGAGFGLGGAAALSTGAYFMGKEGKDSRSLGVSLIAVGATSALLALFFPMVTGEHALSAAETETLVDAYNAELRKKLALRPRDVEEQGE